MIGVHSERYGGYALSSPFLYLTRDHHPLYEAALWAGVLINLQIHIKLRSCSFGRAKKRASFPVPQVDVLHKIKQQTKYSNFKKEEPTGTEASALTYGWDWHEASERTLEPVASLAQQNELKRRPKCCSEIEADLFWRRFEQVPNILWHIEGAPKQSATLAPKFSMSQTKKQKGLSGKKIVHGFIRRIEQTVPLSQSVIFPTKGGVLSKRGSRINHRKIITIVKVGNKGQLFPDKENRQGIEQRAPNDPHWGTSDKMVAVQLGSPQSKPNKTIKNFDMDLSKRPLSVLIDSNLFRPSVRALKS